MREMDAYQTQILLALQAKHVYEGTVRGREKARRRKAGKVAKASRRANRGAGRG